MMKARQNQQNLWVCFPQSTPVILSTVGRKTDWQTNPLRKPNVTVGYNNTIGGVDTLSCVLIPYSSQQQGIKWYHKIAEFFMDICVCNSYILWKKLNPDESQVDHLCFRKQLINELITFHSYGVTKQNNKTGKKNCAENPLHMTDRDFPRTYPKSGKKSSPQISCVRCHSQGKRKDTCF